MNKHQKEIKKIKDLMMNALEQRMTMKTSASNKKVTYLTGEFVCHDERYTSNDSDFLVCGKDTDVAFLITIQKIIL